MTFAYRFLVQLVFLTSAVHAILSQHGGLTAEVKYTIIASWRIRRAAGPLSFSWFVDSGKSSTAVVYIDTMTVTVRYKIMRTFQIFWNLGIVGFSAYIYWWDKNFRLNNNLPEISQDDTMVYFFWIMAPCFIFVWTAISFFLFLCGRILPVWTLVQDCVCALVVIVKFILVMKIMTVRKDGPDTRLPGSRFVLNDEPEYELHEEPNLNNICQRHRDDSMSFLWIVDGVNMVIYLISLFYSATVFRTIRNEWLKAQDNAALDRIFWQKPELTGKLEGDSSGTLA
ncbi:hypothetical protein FPQ18DRAFT_305502 [Pyronema domesticum]|nr:hypothetical protein FPQ18DRAFT_305502 [Pyronema domesticum]